MFVRISHSFIRLAFASLSAATVVLSPGIAEAKTQKPACHSATCRGKDPVAMHCDADASTLASAYARNSDNERVFKIDLRYSRRCNARWARTTYLQYRPGMDFEIYAQLGSGAVTAVWRMSPVVWSKMWSGRIKACGGYPVGSSPTDAWAEACTIAR